MATDTPPAKGAARKRKAPAKGKASSSAMTAATNAGPKRPKVANGGDIGNNEAATADAEENAAPAPEPPRDYIHVRARRGQATDSHSLAERVRRERIGERMKLLQSLVPGCTKITGKALMLDEIINYVQSLQRQVEFVSMKLATMNPELDLDAQVMHPTATAMLAPYPTDPHAATAAFFYADPFAATAGAQPSLESCSTSSFFHPGAGHGFGWEAHDLQSVVHHTIASAHGHGHDQKLPSPPHPQHGAGQQQQAAATVNSHMKVEP